MLCYTVIKTSQLLAINDKNIDISTKQFKNVLVKINKQKNIFKCN